MFRSPNGVRIFKYSWLLPVILATGCASVQDTFCNMIEPDSYVLVSVADCQTMRTSFHYDRDTDFSLLKSYAWMPDEHADDAAGSTTRHGGQPHIWAMVSTDSYLNAKGFRLTQTEPDFLVSHQVSSEMRVSMTLSIIDARSQHLIWRGTLADEGYPARNQDAWKERIRMAVEKLLEQFPPPRQVDAGW
jgi:hypothetical protein